MSRVEGFELSERGGDVRITHRGKMAATLRGQTAARFLEDVARGDPQLVMARVTGNYKGGASGWRETTPRNR